MSGLSSCGNVRPGSSDSIIYPGGIYHPDCTALPESISHPASVSHTGGSVLPVSSVLPDCTALPDGTIHPGSLRLTSRAAKLAGITPGMKLLDVGCGTGASLEFLSRKYGALPFGIDSSHDMIRLARSRFTAAGMITVSASESASTSASILASASESASTSASILASASITASSSALASENTVSLTVCGADALPFPDAFFDAVICECTLSIFADAGDIYLEMFRVLKQNGMFISSDICETGRVEELQTSLDKSGFDLFRFEDHRSALVTYIAELNCFQTGWRPPSSMKNVTYYLAICKRR